MASLNSTLFLGLLVAISAFMAAPSSVEAQIFNVLPGLVRINGTVFCTVNASLSTNGTLPGNAPPFPNALVQLRCLNTTLANTTTNGSGNFNLLLSVPQSIIQFLLSFLPGGSPCRIVIATPLAQCNANLPVVGNLVSNLTQIVGGTIGNVFNFLAASFQLLPM